MEENTNTPDSEAGTISDTVPPTQSHEPQPSANKKLRKKLLILIAVIVVIILGFFVYDSKFKKAISNNRQPSAQKSSLTFYYNDGVTVLWENKKPDKFSEDTEPKTAPYYVNTVRELMKKKYGEKYYQKGSWSVTTTLDKKLQQISEEAVNAQRANIAKQAADAIGFVAEDVTTGQVVAMVGNLAENAQVKDTTINYVRSLQMPGSAIKPLVYAASIENSTNLGAGSELNDSKAALPGYPCTKPELTPKTGGDCLTDYDFRFVGPISLRYALGGSRNIPVVQAATSVGIDKVQETIKKLGVDSGYNCYTDESLKTTAPCFSSAALGEGAYLRLDEEVHAYATLSNNGVKLPHTYLLKVKLDNQTKEEWKPAAGQQAVRADTAYIISDILADPNASYIPANQKSAFNINGHKMSVTTGTISDNKSSSIIGYSTKYAAAFWLGRNEESMIGFAETITIPILTDWLTAVHKDVEIKVRTKPTGIKELPAYINKSHVGVGSVEPSSPTDLFPNWYKP